MPVYRWLRTLHGYTALACALLVAGYAGSGWMILHGRLALRGETGSVERTVPAPELPPGLDQAGALRLAPQVARLAGVSGRIHDPKPDGEGAWTYRFEGAAGNRYVTVAPGAREGTLREEQRPPNQGFAALHHFHRAWGGGAFRAWAWMVDLLGLAMMGFAVSGVWLWWTVKRDHRLGALLLGASTLYTLGSIAWLAFGL